MDAEVINMWLSVSDVRGSLWLQDAGSCSHIDAFSARNSPSTQPGALWAAERALTASPITIMRRYHRHHRSRNHFIIVMS